MLASAFWLAFFGRSGVRALVELRSSLLTFYASSAGAYARRAAELVPRQGGETPSYDKPGGDLRKRRDVSSDRY